jgi:NAD(P)H-hydrate repair Nnr-like enzyme with NAD(P)H-hydrate dehydratase domain
MNRNTLILLALLGFGLYRHFMNEKAKTQPQLSNDPNKIIRQIHDQSQGDSSLAIKNIATAFGVEMGKANEMYEIFRQQLQNDPNFGL